MHITQNPSPNFTPGRSGHPPDMIVCHITEGSFNGAVSWVTNPASGVSYHFLVAQDGRIVQTVDIKNTAWANGTTNGTDLRGNQHATLPAVQKRRANANSYTISVGFEGRFSETKGQLTAPQFTAAQWLLAHIRQEVQRLFHITIPLDATAIVGHSHITPRWKPNCPGQDFPFTALIAALKQKEAEVNQRTEPNHPNLPSQPSTWAAPAWQWAINQGITDGTNPQGTPSREQMITLLYNYHQRLHA